MGIQGGSTRQPFLLNSIFENLGLMLWRAPPPFTRTLQLLRAPQGTTAVQYGQWVGWHVERGDVLKDAYHFFV